MDYRCDHLSEEQRQEPPMLLYAMDLGDGGSSKKPLLWRRVPYDVLKQRAAALGSARRADHRGDP